MQPIAAALSLVLCTAVAAQTLQEQPARTIAQAYGIDGWDRVEEIHFTFNVDTGDRQISRQWSWQPKEGRVTLHRPGAEPITYDRDELSPDTPEAVVAADRQFINDHYWLLFPFQPVWSNPATTYEGTAALPIGEGEAHKVTVQFPSEGGYTPGDAYDLYVTDDGMIRQWVFRRGGQPEGSPITWEGNAKLGPIRVSTEHRTAQGHRRLWFDNLSVRLTGEETPATTQPLPE